MENCVFLGVFYVFHHVNLIFFKNSKSLEHLNVFLRIFFVSGVFQNFIFYHPYESIYFQPAGFLAFKEKSGPLLPPYFYFKLINYQILHEGSIIWSKGQIKDLFRIIENSTIHLYVFTLTHIHF